MNTPNVRVRRRKERKVLRIALAASLLLHLLVLVAGGRRPLPRSPLAAAGPEAGDARAARGGLQTMSIRVPPPRPIVPPPVPVLAEIDVEPVEFDLEAEFDLAAVLGEKPGDGPPGLDGDGEGDGGEATEGLSEVSPPRQRHLIYPPDHKDLRKITIWVFVDEEGRAVADSTRLEPPTGNRSLNRQIIKEASQWRFYPAHRGGQPVAAWFSYTVSRGGTGRPRAPIR